MCRPGRTVGVTALTVAMALVLGGCAMLFPTEPGESLAHFEDEAPAVGDPVPEFELSTLDGTNLDLRDHIGARPIVIQLGSHSCPVYRYRRFGMRKLRDEFAGRVDFIVVYTLEAHPTGTVSPYADREWRPFINRLTGVDVTQPDDIGGRIEQARRSTDELEIGSLVVVDSMTNETWKAYGSAPSPAFIVDTQGRIALRQVWTDPDQIAEILREILAGE